MTAMEPESNRLRRTSPYEELCADRGYESGQAGRLCSFGTPRRRRLPEAARDGVNLDETVRNRRRICFFSFAPV